MSDGTFTKADIDAAVAAAVAKVQESVEKLESKNDELVGEVRKYKAEARKAGEITPDTLAAVEAERDKAQADLAEANKALKTAATDRDKAVKALETEQMAARSYAIDAEIAGAIAAGNVTPALVPAFKALVAQQAKADIVDGKLAVLIGDKPAAEHIKALLASDDGKHFVAAPINGGGGAPGGGGGAGGKTITRAQYDADPVAGMRAVREGAQVVDA